MIERIKDIWVFIGALFERMDKIHMSLIAAGVAFYAMFAVFPGLAIVLSVLGITLVGESMNDLALMAISGPAGGTPPRPGPARACRAPATGAAASCRSRRADPRAAARWW